MASNVSRHEQLLTAGWQYDAASGYYTAPNSPTDGTARRYNLDAAWLAFTHQQVDDTETKQDKATPKTRAKDPREQEPQ